MSCAELDELLSAYADGQTVPAQSEFIELHVQTCGRCQTVLQAHRETRRLIQSSFDDLWLPPDISSRVSRTHAQSAQWQVRTARLWTLAAALVALLVMLALHTGNQAMESDRVSLSQGPLVASASQAPSCRVCDRKTIVHYARVKGHMVPVTLAREVAYDLAAAVPPERVPSVSWPADRLDKLLGPLTTDLKGGEARSGQHPRQSGPQPI